MDIWVLQENGRRTRLSVPFHPTISVGGPKERLRWLGDVLSSHEGVRRVEMVERVLDVQHRSPSPSLRIDISRYSMMGRIAEMIEGWGRWKEFELYDVDIRLPTRYFMENGIYPLAHVEVTSSFRVLDEPDWVTSHLPPLSCSRMDIIPEKNGPVPSMDDRLTAVQVDDEKVEGGSEEDLILELVSMIGRKDPDILTTSGGDSFGMPYLQYRARVNNVEGKLILDRSGSPLRAPFKKGTSHFSYGNVLYKPSPCLMNGRLHIDERNSFVVKEGGLLGLALLSRLSLLPLQSMARLSPGSAISYMECVEAARRGYLIRWKKNLAEEWKSGLELIRSDRGGHIFDPIVGAFSDVVEMDFSSFYPHIMWKKNISVETLNCECCTPEQKNTVPGLGYHICSKQQGLISTVVGRVLESRMRYKRMYLESEGAPYQDGEADLGPLKPPEGKGRYHHASNMLKWLLVTCFGYTGYKNARFGRIEAHESITAYAREFMLRAKEVAEEAGFSILHGIVDSLWIKGPLDGADEVAAAIERGVDIPISVDARYRWIAFLPNRANGVGALTRYYGVRDDGEIKVRGLEIRQHSTPKFISDLQTAVIQALSASPSAEEVPSFIPDAFSVLGRYGEVLRSREVDPADLALTIRTSRTLDEYTTDSEHVAAMKLLRRAGFEVNAGQKVRFVVLDHGSRRPEARVCLLDDDMDGVRYDVNRYLELSARAAASALSVFGVDEKHALMGLKGVEQKRLMSP